MNDHAGPHWNEPSPLPDRKPPMPEVTLTPNEYQRRAAETAIYRDGIESLLDSLDRKEVVDLLCEAYLILGMMDEVGEVASLYKRLLRDGTDFPQQKLCDELGGVCYYPAMLAKENCIPFAQVLSGNNVKLADRASRGTIKGKGDER